MRRLAFITALAATAIAATTFIGSGAQATSDYRVDAIFDTAKGIIPGQLVKIAGVRVGTVKDVKLTPDYKARIEMKIDGKFANFRSDASCNIQPEGLISENFVQCDPGTPAGDPLPAVGGHAPTLPVTHTSVPVSITDLFNIWKTPIRERFSIVVASLGMGAAGRGEDFNEILARASPTLALTRKAARLLNRQRGELSSVIKSTDNIVAQLAPKSPRLASFIDHASAVTAQTGSHHTELAEGTRRLPGLLDATRAALTQLDKVTSEGTPLLRDLHGAAPDVQKLVDHLAPFATAGKPAVASLGRLAVTGRTTVKSATPLVKQLKTFAHQALPTGLQVGDNFASLKQQAVPENLLYFIYNAAAGESRYDSISHILPARFDLSQCSMFATTPSAACNGNYTPVAAAKKQRKTGSKAPQRPATPKPSLPQLQLPDLPKANSLKLPKVPQVPELPGELGRVVDSVVGPLLRGDDTAGVTGRLLDYLLSD